MAKLNLGLGTPMNFATEDSIMKSAIARLNGVNFSHVKNTGNIVGDGIVIDRQAYIKILAHMCCRLDIAKTLRDQIVPVYKYIDREYYAYLKRDADDAKRDRDNFLAKGIKPTDEKLSMIFAQIDEAVTYLLTVLAPDDAMYTAMAPKDKQPLAKGLAKLMNMHDEKYGHYRAYGIWLNDCLRYNLGAIGIEWDTVFGSITPVNTGNPNQGGTDEGKRIVFSGNNLTAYDPYNCLIDPSVNPVLLSSQGEFFGHAELETPFRLRMEQQAGNLYNVDSFIKSYDNNALQTLHYFEPHEQTRNDYAVPEKSMDWFRLLSGVNTDTYTEELSMRETLRCFAWINPKKLGISKEDEYQIWKFRFGGKSHILNAEPVKNSHALLPVHIAMPVEDHFSYQTRGIAERLIPYQRFASFTMNTHQRSTRKKLYGLTFYDKNAIDFSQQGDIDMTGGRIPVTLIQNAKISDKVQQFTDGPDTTYTLENISAMDEIMQKILPTNILQQVASLERATQYQSAALVQGANRRNLKIAKTINSQAMNNIRLVQVYNIIKNQDVMEVLTEEGEITTVDPKTLEGQLIEFTISDGLKGLDRLALQINMKELFNTLVQSKQAVAQVDVMDFANYISTLFGDNTDLSQFKLKSPLDSQPKEVRDLAFQLVQQYMAAQQQNAGAAATPSSPAPAGGANAIAP